MEGVALSVSAPASLKGEVIGVKSFNPWRSIVLRVPSQIPWVCRTLHRVGATVARRCARLRRGAHMSRHVLRPRRPASPLRPSIRLGLTLTRHLIRHAAAVARDML